MEQRRNNAIREKRDLMALIPGGEQRHI